MTDYNLDDGLERPGDKPEETTILDRLAAEVSKEVERPEIQIPVPAREGVAVRFSPNITQEQVKRWRKRAGAESKNGLDTIHFSALVVGSTCTGIYFDEELVTDSAGNAVDFTSQAILDMVDEDRPVPEGIQAFYGVDPHLEQTALKVLDYAGFGDDVEVDEDPLGS